MLVKYTGYLTAEIISKCQPHLRFVFGDNILRVGRGGMAALLRGHPQAIGVVTKRTPSNNDNAFFSDTEFGDFDAIRKDMDAIEDMLYHRKLAVCWPGSMIEGGWESSIGMGLAQLSTKAPGLCDYIDNRLDMWSQHFACLSIRDANLLPQVK